MSSKERREQIVELICMKRYVTISELIRKLNVSKSTILRDITELSLSYPIYTKDGRNGGIYIEEGFRLNKKEYLSDEQENLLKELTGTVNESQAKILQQILSTFRNPIKQG